MRLVTRVTQIKDAFKTARGDLVKAAKKLVQSSLVLPPMPPEGATIEYNRAVTAHITAFLDGSFFHNAQVKCITVVPLGYN